MTDDHDEELRARARRSDPETSHEAANSLPSDRLRASQDAVLAFLRRQGPMIDTVLVDTYNGEVHQSPSGLRTRRSELVTRGLVQDTGVRVRLATGRNAIVWAVTQ